MAELPDDKRMPFQALVAREAQLGFQYLYQNFALYETGRKGNLQDPAMQALFQFLRGERFLAFASVVTGCDDIAFTDCQLTRYRAGHFLNAHDDQVEGKNRRGAYILNMTANWRADFGGLLQVIDEKGDIEAAFTGWLRSGEEPPLPG